MIAKTKHKYFGGWKSVGNVPREISRYIYSFIKKESERISGTMKSLNYNPLLIPSGGLEVPLLLTVSCPEEWVQNKMKHFIDNLYTYDFTGIIHNYNNSDESETEIDLKLTEKEHDAEEGKSSVSAVDDKVTARLLL